MKEMVYTTERKCEILHSGEYKDHKFAILNLGTHPTAYVECKFPKCSTYDDERFDTVCVHGGFTYLNTPAWDKNDTTTIYVGWDYGHFGDYMGYKAHFPELSYSYNKRWTTTEIFEEVKSVIDQLLQVEATELTAALKGE